METQEARRDRQQQIQQVQQQLKTIHAELDKTSRGEDRYLHLITQEHAIIKQEKQLLDEFQHYEKSEREYFNYLSTAVRESHEKERAQSEKTKYWSIIGSICGAIIGIIGTTVNNWLRMRELRGLVVENGTNGTVQNMLGELSDLARNQHNALTLFLADLKGLLGSGNTGKSDVLPGVTVSEDRIQAEVLDVVRKQEDVLKTEMKEIKALIVAKNAADGSGDKDSHAAVYIGRDVEDIMRDAQQNLEYKIKVNSLATVVMIYAALAVTVPFIFKAFGGS